MRLLKNILWTITLLAMFTVTVYALLDCVSNTEENHIRRQLANCHTGQHCRVLNYDLLVISSGRVK